MPSRTYTIGRDASNDLVLADPSIAAEHAAITIFDDGSIELFDRGSGLPTAIARGSQRQSVSAPTALFGTDVVVFGDLEVPVPMLVDMARQAELERPRDADGKEPTPPAPDRRPRRRLGLSARGLEEFFPVYGALGRMRDRGMLLPAGAFTVVLAALWASTSNPLQFVNVLGIAITFGALYFIYRLCGHRRPMWMIAAVMLAEVVVLRGGIFDVLAIVFRPPVIGRLLNAETVPALFIGHFVGAGLFEELCKMLPVFGVIWLTYRLLDKHSLRWGVTEPLDAVLYACASAAVFIIDETLFGYVPGAMTGVSEASGNAGLGMLAGLQLVITRTLDSLTGHMAFSGYFAYFVGLGLLRPRERVRLWAGGYVIASAIHGLGNAVSAHPLAGLVVSTLSFLFLVAVIVNARKLSPQRSQNFATLALTTRRAKRTASRADTAA